MLKDPFHWFPDLLFGSILGYSFLLISLIDSLLPRIFNSRRKAPAVIVQDRWSFLLIQIAEILTLGGGLILRYFRIGITSAFFQYAGLVIMISGFLFRSWAMLSLGRYFSRVVEIENGHHLITTGPYRYVRHPAYTGMLMIFLGALLGIGTWAGALFGMLVLGAATLYRIRVEEKVLLQQFGEEYLQYGARRGRLLPGF
ncbi:MAG TPA: isoprenylcysteine carboxylmethyltransferase family protein [Anaerolineales bacterium]